MSLTLIQSDWLTIPAAALHFDIPEELIERAITDGRIEVQKACGARVIRKSELSVCDLILEYGAESVK
jgi:hypothetical protein